MKRLLAVLVSVFLLSACGEVKIKDGKIPEQYLEQARLLEGIYDGEISGLRGQLTFFLQDRRAVLSFENEFGSDPVSPFCESKIGKIEAVTTGSSGGEAILKSARFAFDPNLCAEKIEGRSVHLFFENAWKSSQGLVVDVRILEYTEGREICRIEHDPNGVPRTVCRIEKVGHYIEGRFRKR